MKRFALILALTLATPLGADTPAPEDAPQPFLQLLDETLRGFMHDMAPRLRALEEGFSALEPDLDALTERLRGMTQYHPPEMLPNGDILIRRRTEPAPEDAPVPEDGPVLEPLDL